MCGVHRINERELAGPAAGRDDDRVGKGDAVFGGHGKASAGAVRRSTMTRVSSAKVAPFFIADGGQRVDQVGNADEAVIRDHQPRRERRW